MEKLRVSAGICYDDLDAHNKDIVQQEEYSTHER